MPGLPRLLSAVLVVALPLTVAAAPTGAATPVVATPPQPDSTSSSPPVPTLRVERLSGDVTVDRLGRRRALRDGDTLGVRDIVRTGAGSAVALDLPGYGGVELSSDAELSVEQLPSAAATPLPQPWILSLARGDLHLQWQSLPGVAATPVYVYVDDHRAALMPGEYVIGDRAAGGDQLCVSQGQALSMSLSAGTRTSVPAYSCQRWGAAVDRVVASGPAAWTGLRRRFAFSDLTTLPAEAGAAPALQLEAASALHAAEPNGSGPTLAAPKDAAIATPRRRASASAAADDNAAGWAINVASYSDVGAARRQRDELQQSGYQAVVVPAQVDGRTWYRVQVSGFPNAGAAHSKAVALQTDMGFHQVWVTRQP